MELEINVKKEEKTLELTLNGELNTGTAPKLADVLEKNLDGVDALYLDFASCDYVSSAGLRVLLGTYKSLRAKNKEMVLLKVGPNFTDVLKITGLDNVFNVK